MMLYLKYGAPPCPSMNFGAIARGLSLLCLYSVSPNLHRLLDLGSGVFGEL